MEHVLVVSDDSALRKALRTSITNVGLRTLEPTFPGTDLAGVVNASSLATIAVVDLRMDEPSPREICESLLAKDGRHGSLFVIGLLPPEREDLLELAIEGGVEEFLYLPPVPRLVETRIRAQVDSIHLSEVLATQANDLELILELTSRFAATTDVDTILFELVSLVAGTLGIDRCSLVLSDDDWCRGVVVATSDDSRIEDLEIDLNSYPEIQEVLQTGEPLVIQDPTGHPLVAAVKDTLKDKGVGALAVLPLHHQKEPMGVLFLRASPSRAPLPERIIRVARTIAHTTAVALRNARMFERIRQQSAQATAATVEAQREVADLRQIESELRKTKHLLENLIDSSASAIVAADMRGRVRVWNKAAERVLGYSRDEALDNLNVWDIYYDDARSVMAALRAEDGPGPGKLEEHPVHIVSRQGERIPVTLSASILYEDGEEIATVGILTDMRDRIRIEEKLSRAQDRLMRTEKQVMIAELAGTTAHELNQPLTSVMGYAELLKRRVKPSDPNHRAIDIIFRESERMAEIVRKIGRITRYETKNYLGKTRIVDLDKSADDAD